MFFCLGVYFSVVMFKYWYIYRIREIHTIVIVGLFNFTKIILLIWHVVKIHIT